VKPKSSGTFTVRFPRHGRANEWLQFLGRILDRVSPNGFDARLHLKMGVLPP
jgi:hypothetical protein